MIRLTSQGRGKRASSFFILPNLLIGTAQPLKVCSVIGLKSDCVLKRDDRFFVSFFLVKGFSKQIKSIVTVRIKLRGHIQHLDGLSRGIKAHVYLPETG